MAAGVSRNVASSLVARAWTGVLWVALVPIYLKLLGAEAYGLIGLYLSLTAMAQLFDFGLASTITRELARYRGGGEGAQLRDLLATGERIAWTLAALIAGMLWLSFWVYGLAWVKPERLPVDSLNLALALAGLAIGVQFPVLYYSGGLWGLSKHTWVAAVAAVFATVRGVGAVLLLQQVAASPEIFFGWHCLCGFGHSITLGLSLKRASPSALREGAFNPRSLFAVWRFAAGMAALSIMSVAVLQADKILLSWWLPLKQFGHYMVAVAMSSVPQMIFAPVAAALMPELARLLAADKTMEAAQIYRRFLAWLATALAPAFALALFLPRQILDVWSGDPSLAGEVASVLTWLTLGTCINGLMHIPYAWQIARGWPQAPLHATAVSACVLVPALWLGARQYDAAGAASAWFAFNVAYFIVTLRFMSVRAPETRPLHALLIEAVLPFAAAAVPCAALAVLAPSMSRALHAYTLVGVALASLLAAAVASPVCRRDLLTWMRHNARGRA